MLLSKCTGQELFGGIVLEAENDVYLVPHVIKPWGGIVPPKSLVQLSDSWHGPS